MWMNIYTHKKFKLTFFKRYYDGELKLAVVWLSVCRELQKRIKREIIRKHVEVCELSIERRYNAYSSVPLNLSKKQNVTTPPPIESFTHKNESSSMPGSSSLPAFGPAFAPPSHATLLTDDYDAKKKIQTWIHKEKVQGPIQIHFPPIPIWY